MTDLGNRINSLPVEPHSVAIFWLAQAGFAIKTSSGEVIYIDAYLSDMCETTLAGGLGSKRLMPPPMEISEITSGVMASTHMHQDHNDEEAVEIVAKKSSDVQFVGPVSSFNRLKDIGIPEDRIHQVDAGDVYKFSGGRLRGVYADHGEGEPDAIGYIVETDDGLRVYHTGDTCYCPERMEEAIQLRPDVMIGAINGTFGNMDGIEAAQLAADVGAKVAIPCHFWMFIVQNQSATGTPKVFVDACEDHAPNALPVLMRVGEHIVVSKNGIGEVQVEQKIGF